MLKIPFRKSLSLVSSLCLASSLLIASQQSANADDFTTECPNGLNPVIVGRVIDSSANGIPYASVQATFEIDFGTWIERRSTNVTAAPDGTYEMCPLLADDSSIAPTPAVGSDITFAFSTWDDPSVTIKKFDVSNDDYQCIELGGPCVFDLATKQGNKASFRAVAESDPNSGSTFDGQIYGAATVIDEGEGNWLDVFHLGGFQTSANGSFDVYGMSQGEFRLALRPNQSDNLMSSAWQVLVDDSDNQTVTKLAGWGDGEAVRSDSTTGLPIESVSGVLTLPNPAAATKFMLTDGTIPLSSDHLAWPDDRARVIASGDGADIRFINDPLCDLGDGETYTDDEKSLCAGLMDINYRGEFLLPWEYGFYRIGAHFGYNQQGVETYFVLEISNSQIVNIWRNSGYAMDDELGQVFKWQEIDFVNNNSGVTNGLTLLQLDLGVKLANYQSGDFWIGGYLCSFAGACNSDEMGAGQFSLYGGNVSELGQIAFPDAAMLGVSCDDSITGDNPELQLFIDAGGWSPANSASSRYAIDCAGELGAREFAGYELVGTGDTKTAGDAVDLQNLVLDTAQVTGLVIDPDSNPVNTSTAEFYPINSDGTRDNSVMNYRDNLQIQSYWGTNSDHFGKFNLSASTSGSYAVTFSVEDGSQALAGAIGKIRLDVVVGPNGDITSAKYGSSLSTTPVIDALVNPIHVTLSAANLKGTMFSQNGQPRRYQYFQVLRFNPDSNINWNDGYEYFNDVRNTSSNGSGAVSIYLPPGQYRMVLPASAGQPKTDFDVWVDGQGSTCRFVSQTGNASCGAGSISDWSFRYAEPNLRGTVTAGGIPAASQVNIQKRNSSGWWEGTGDYIGTSDGEFAARLSTTGYYRLELQPRNWSDSGQQPLEGYVQSFAFIKVDSSKRLCVVSATTDFDAQLQDCSNSSSRELDAEFPLGESNLTIKVLAATTSGGELRPASWSGMDIRETTTNQFMGESTWSNTNTNGKAFLNLPESQGRTRFFEITIRPPWNGNGLILANKVRKFCTVGDGNVYVATSDSCGNTPIDDVFEVELAEGNVSGRIKTSDNQNLPTDAMANAELRIWANTCPDCNGNANTWGWKWTNNGLNNPGNGTFGGDLPPGTYLVKASTWRSNYAPGAAIIRVGTNDDEHPWCLVAADAEVLDIPEYNNAESKLEAALTDAVANEAIGVSDCDPLTNPATALNVLLKAPNIRGTITDPSGATIRNAWGHVYKVTGVNDWDREYVSGINVQSGRFVGRIKLPSSGTTTYGLQFEQPQGQEGSRFTVSLTCTSAGCISAPGNQASDSLALAYPAPNFVGRICSPESIDAIPASGENPATDYICDAVKYTNMNVQRWDGNYWQWENIWANTNSKGVFSLNLEEAGSYRLTAYPAWNNPKGVQTNVEFEMSLVDGSLVASFDSNDDSDTQTTDILDIQLLGPNLSGKLEFNSTTGARAMQYGGISASLQCTNICPNWEERFAWTSADRTGSYRLRLPTDGYWDIWAYSNSSVSPKPPVHMIARVVNGVVTEWEYAATVSSEFEPRSFGEINFDALPANLSVTVTGTTEIRIIKFKDSNNEYVDELTTYTSGGATNTVSTRVPDGAYSIEVLKSSREQTSGTVSVTAGSSLQLVSISVQ